MASTAVAEKRTGKSRGQKPKPPPSVVNVATSHRIKVRFLIRAAERPTSPASVGRELGMQPSKVSYHARVLAEFHLVEQIEERPVRGAVEHFYRTVSLAEVNEEQYEKLPLEVREAWLEVVFGLFGADAQFSIEMNVLPKQTDCEISRTAMKVDPQGFREIRNAYIDLQERVMDIKAGSETRLATNAELKPRWILSFNALFDMPPPQ